MDAQNENVKYPATIITKPMQTQNLHGYFYGYDNGAVSEYTLNLWLPVRDKTFRNCRHGKFA